MDSSASPLNDGPGLTCRRWEIGGRAHGGQSRARLGLSGLFLQETGLVDFAGVGRQCGVSVVVPMVI